MRPGFEDEAMPNDDTPQIGRIIVLLVWSIAVVALAAILGAYEVAK